VIDPGVQARVNALSRALAELPPLSAVVFRSAELSSEQLAGYQPGALIEEAGFLSCTRDPALAGGGNCTFAVRSVTGKDISTVTGRPREAEVVFDRSTAFRVLQQATDPDTGRAEIVLEEVARDRSAILGPA
jgi:hypothetical protein